MTMTREEIARLLVLQKVILDTLRSADAETRDQARQLFKPGAAEPVELDDHDLGRVAMTRGRVSWAITDPEAFQDWVAEIYPDEIVTTASVRSSFRDAILARCKADGGLLDTETGELVAPPGVTERTGAPILTVKPTNAAPGVVLARMGDIGRLLELEP